MKKRRQISEMTGRSAERKKGIKQRRRAGAVALAAVLTAASLPGAVLAGESGEDMEGAMGRYVETELTTPENTQVRDIVRMENGTLRIIGEYADSDETDDAESGISYRIWDSADGGETWEEAAALPAEFENAYFIDMTLARSGGGAGILFQTEEDSADDCKYELVSFDAEGNVKRVSLGDNPMWSCCFTEDDVLIANSAGSSSGVVIDPDTGEVTALAESGANVVASCGKEALLLGSEALQRYNPETGEPLERDEALEEALFADGSSYEITNSASSPIVFAEDEDGRLFYATHKGIFSHVMDGSVVEQAVNGELSSLGDPSCGTVALEVQNQCFYLLCTGDAGKNKLVKFAYDDQVPSAPQRELTVYSLRENSGIRKAASQFQKQYPDTAVNYVVGMSGEDGVTSSDALRLLNTDILAGNGPDVLVMDGMNVDTYAQKGLLADLSDAVNAVKDSDGLIETIAYTYQQEDSLPAVAAKFGIPMAAGNPELLQTADGLEGLKKLAEQEGALYGYNMVLLPEILYPMCAGAWKKDDGTIDQDALLEYVSAVRQIYETYQEHVSGNDLEILEQYQQYRYEILSELASYNGDLSGSEMGLLAEPEKVVLGSLNGMYTYSTLTSVNRVTGMCQEELAKGQQTNVFIPSCILGISNGAKEQERAFDFINYMLSQDAQAEENNDGFPVNRAAFEKRLHEPEYKDGEMTIGSEDNRTGERVDLQVFWPSEEELQKLKDFTDQLNVRAEGDAVQRETVLEETRRCMEGEITAEEAVNTIMQKVNLYLAE